MIRTNHGRCIPAKTAAALLLPMSLLAGTALAGDDDDGNSGGPIVIDDGTVFEGTVTCVEPKFEAYTLTKETRVCFDPVVEMVMSGDDDDDGGSSHAPVEIDACDPFPDDGLFTYVYRLTNAADSLVPTSGLEIRIAIDSDNVIDAGALPGDGVAPGLVQVFADRVQWFFTPEALIPGASSQELYIVSPLGPDEVAFSVFGAFALDCQGLCVGPAVPCDFCTVGGGGGGGDDDDDGGPAMPERIQFSCPFGLAVGDNGPVADEVSTIEAPTYTVTKEVTVCFDPACGANGCDPFPEDGLYTYQYRITNDGRATEAIRKIRIKVPNYTARDAGALPGKGLAPSVAKVRRDRVIWVFDPPLQPGESTQVLDLTSPQGPADVEIRLYGSDRTRVSAPCIGPKVGQAPSNDDDD